MDKQTKPFPWRCARCNARTVRPAVLGYTTNVAHDGRQYAVTVPDLEVPRCEKCGRMVLTSAANQRIDAAFREQLQLLAPEEIRHNRELLGLKQKEMAARLGIAEATLSRWETGAQIQQRAMDNLLRLFFQVPQARSFLSEMSHEPVGVGNADR